jgi:serine protease Do
MKQYLLRISGLAAMAILSYSPVFSQQGDDQDSTLKKIHSNVDEIIIKSKNDKNVKLSVEIRDGQVFINDKPMSEFKDDNVVVHKMRTMDMDGEAMTLLGDANGDGDFKMLTAPRSPYRMGKGSYSFNIDEGKGAFLGVSSEKGDDDIAGARVKQVTKGSGAEKAGLKPGDLITRVNETTISDPEDLTQAIHKCKPEDKVNLTFKRDGKEQKAVATLGKMKDGSYSYSYGNDGYAMPDMKDFNFNLAPLRVSPKLFSYNDSRPKLGIKAQDTEDGKGVKVLDIDEESPADKAGIKEGDIITRFDGKEVNSAVELADLARESKGKADLKISLTHDGKSREVEVKIPKKLKTADL